MNSHQPEQRPVIIGIGGGSGSGKTTVALRVQERFPEHSVEIIHHDSYYRDHAELSAEERAAINFDHPSAFETRLLLEHLDEQRPVEEVFKRVRKDVVKASRGKQIPWEHSSLSKTVYFYPPRNEEIPEIGGF